MQLKRLLLLTLLVVAGCVNSHPIHDLRPLNARLHKSGEEAYYKNGTVHILRFVRCGPNKFCAKATGQSNTEMLSHQDLADNVTAGNFLWSGSALAGSTLITDETTFASNVRNTGSCSGPTNRLIPYGDMVNCRVLTSAQTALNNSFATTCSGWTLAGVTSTGIYSDAPGCGSSGDYDTDGNFDGFSTASAPCAATGSNICAGTAAYTFSISASSGISAESITFEYKGSVAAASGDVTNCNPTTGSIGLSLKVNSTAITLPSLTWNGAWNGSGSVSLGSSLVNGSNTITFTHTGQTTANQSSHYNATTQEYLCNIYTYTNNSNDVDAIIITATY